MREQQRIRLDQDDEHLADQLRVQWLGLQCLPSLACRNEPVYLINAQSGLLPAELIIHHVSVNMMFLLISQS